MYIIPISPYSLNYNWYCQHYFLACIIWNWFIFYIQRVKYS